MAASRRFAAARGCVKPSGKETDPAGGLVNGPLAAPSRSSGTLEGRGRARTPSNVPLADQACGTPPGSPAHRPPNDGRAAAVAAPYDIRSMANPSAVVASGLPVLPPVPAGPEPIFRARGLAALIAALDDAIISHRAPTGDAIVVVVGGRVVDAIAVPAGRPPMVGLDALNVLGPADSANLRAAAVDRRLALSLPSYWREADRLHPISARWVDPAGLIAAMIRPGRRGAIVLRSPTDLGLVLFDESGLVGAYSQSRPEPGPLDTLAPLLTHTDTVVHGRIADASGRADDQPQAHEERAVALPDPIERCRGEIVRMAQSTLHLHSEGVAARFRAAPATTQGLLLAAEQVRGMRKRLVNPATFVAIAEEAERIVRVASRGS